MRLDFVWGYRNRSSTDNRASQFMPSLAVSFAESQKPLLQLEGPPSEDGWSAFEQSSGEVSPFVYVDVRNLVHPNLDLCVEISAMESFKEPLHTDPCDCQAQQNPPSPGKPRECTKRESSTTQQSRKSYKHTHTFS